MVRHAASDPGRDVLEDLDLDNVGNVWSAAVDVDDEIRTVGDYAILGSLGRGSFGEVFEAIDGFDKRVAVKIWQGALTDDHRRWRFRGEVERLADLRLHCVPRIHGRGIHEGRPYLVSDLVEGRPIDEHAAEQGLGTRPRVGLVLELVRAVEEIHGRGVIHRDLKPDNVLVESATGEIKIIDFGLAVDDAEARDPRDLGGAPGFTAPEQFDRKIGDLTVRSDVYALGRILEHLLAEAPQPPRGRRDEADRILHAIIERATATCPAERQATARDLGDDLAAWLEGVPIRWTRPPLWMRARHWIRSYPLWSVAAVGVLVLVVGVTAAHQAVRLLGVSRIIISTLQNLEATTTRWGDPGDVADHLETLLALEALVLHPDLEPHRPVYSDARHDVFLGALYHMHGPPRTEEERAWYERVSDVLWERERLTFPDLPDRPSNEPDHSTPEAFSGARH